MQLIVDTETTLDIEANNMSTVDNIQNNKIENLNIEDLNQAKCNGNEEFIEENTTSENEKSAQLTNEIKEPIENITMSIENNEAELSNVDLSKVISEKNILGAKDVLTDESQKTNSEKELNRLGSVEKETISDPIPEEDYIEDDIITISDEHFHIILNSTKEKDTDNETHILEEPFEKDNIENFEVKTKTVLQIENIETDEDDDVIELIEESEDLPVQCKKEQEALINEEKDDTGVVEESRDYSVQNEKKTEFQFQEEKDKVEIITESKNSPLQCNNKTESTIQENDDVEIIEQSIDSITKSQKETELPVQAESDKIEVIEEKIASPVPCEVITEAIIIEEKDKIDVTVEVVSSPCESKSDDSLESNPNETELVKEDRKDETKVIEEKKDITVQCENGTDLPIKEAVKDETKFTEESSKNTVQSENETDSKTEEKDDVEIINDTKVPSDQCENNTELSLKVISNRNETAENGNSKGDSTDSTEVQCESIKALEATKIDAVEHPIGKDDVMDVDEVVDEPESIAESVNTLIELKDNMDVEEVDDNSKTTEKNTLESKEIVPAPAKNFTNQPICKLSNTLDILSDDDEEELPRAESPKIETPKLDPPKVADINDKQCINIEDDDDIMVIGDDVANKAEENKSAEVNNKEQMPIVQPELNKDSETGEKIVQEETTPLRSEEKDSAIEINISEKIPDTQNEEPKPPPLLVPDNFVKTAKKKLADMTRDELEEFCILKIVESIVDRSNLGEIKSKIQFLTKGLDDYRKKAMMLSKQNRDLQVVLKSIQEEQKKSTGDLPITPLKITRSVGMQVFMESPGAPKKKGLQQNISNKIMNTTQTKNINCQGSRPQKNTQAIPVPRLVPANNPALKSPSTIPQVNQTNANKNNPPPNGINRIPSPSTKAEKRPYNKIGSSNVTVDLTDDEPPTKLPGGPKALAPPVRVVPSQNLMAGPRQPFGPGVNSPRKVYIPISGPQNQALRPGQTIMLKSVPAGMRPRCPTPHMTRVEPNAVRMRVAARHPAPLPPPSKQYQPPNWKSLPPAPDLKLSKVENGIVISWKIEGVSEDTYEEIASYQLYAYQETASPPNTSLWKKIGDVKALPLPMACTLTQFMAGFKYYFAVRAVDIKSRIGPFSLPGSILLLSKNI